MATLQAKSVRRREDVRLLTGKGNYAADAAPAGLLTAVFAAVPSGACPDHLAGCVGGPRGAWRARRRGDRRRPDGRGADPGRHRLPAAGWRPGAEDRPPAAGERSRPLRRRTVRDGAGRHQGSRAGGGRGDPGRVRRPAGGDRSRTPPWRRARRPCGTTCPTISASCGSAAMPMAPTAALAGSAHVTTLDFTVSRVTANTMEPRGAWACIAPDGRIELHASNQSPFGLRNAMASGNFNIPNTDIRVLPGDVGGSFGMKSGVHQETVLVAWAARRFGCPVRWISDRTEGLPDRRAGAGDADPRLPRPRQGRAIHRAEAALGRQPRRLCVRPVRLGRRQYRRHRRRLP